MTDETRIKVGRVVSGGITGSQRNEIAGNIAEGGISVISGGKLGGRDGAAALHAGEIGAAFAQPSVELHEGLTRVISSALGVPANLILSDGDGAAARESFRRFAATTINSTLLTIQTEWAAKVGPLDFSLDGLRASDETARARAVGSRANAVSRLVTSGVPLDQALALAGVD